MLAIDADRHFWITDVALHQVRSMDIAVTAYAEMQLAPGVQVQDARVRQTSGAAFSSSGKEGMMFQEYRTSTGSASGTQVFSTQK